MNGFYTAKEKTKKQILKFTEYIYSMKYEDLDRKIDKIEFLEIQNKRKIEINKMRNHLGLNDDDDNDDKPNIIIEEIIDNE
tara:strand:+ start:1371 stop:1613 length:243 start_codon:yes stop_codon:yes gene_type:complete